MKLKKRDKEGVFKSLFAAYFVLLLHVFLLAGVGLTVVLFRGVYNYLPWIMGGIAVMIIALFWIFYLRVKRSTTDIKDVLNHPAFRDRQVEIKLIGGLASFKIDAPGQGTSPLLLGDGEEKEGRPLALLEDGHRNIERRLSELAALYDRDLIDDEEYDTAKKRILFEARNEFDAPPGSTEPHPDTDKSETRERDTHPPLSTDDEEEIITVDRHDQSSTSSEPENNVFISTVNEHGCRSASPEHGNSVSISTEKEESQ